MSLSRYEAYKPSGVAWLGEIPAYWEMRPLKSIIKKSIGGVWGKDPTNTNSDIVCLRVSDFNFNQGIFKTSKLTKRTISTSEQNGRLLQKGDLVIEKSGGGEVTAVGRVVLFNHDFPAVCSNFTNRLVIVDQVLSTFAAKLFQTLFSCKVNIKHIKQTTGIQNLDLKSYFTEQIAVPPLPEQEAIVRYLDHATHKIDRTVRAKKKLIAALNEQKQAIIAHAVTRGLDPNAPMKESGVAWIGEIPAHWEMKRGKALFRKNNRPILPEYDVVTCFRDGEVTLRKNRRTTGFTEALKEIGYQGVNKGDLVIHAMDAFAGAVGVSDSNGKCSPVYAICSPIAEVFPKYYALIIREMARNQWIAALSKGIRERSTDFRFDMFGTQHLPVPPFAEQEAIIRYLDEETTSIDKAIELSKKEIDLLQEYKTRLIADAVTGAVDVRELAKELPEIVEEIDDENIIDETDDEAVEEMEE
ncbi:restriction endonuclease subunit S [Sulfuricurvum sp. IAE1]|uniref:restriction endonuclease subunit S n=1 Tax=Sulfuricurvum sp. IAE1 TaxID=2546102 RepID=UPI0010469432|nr:restriction endonuclease subunit S [Sulfuricurvum sp. IAE1]TDA64112.1 restriction endonuclease subunit S [Sulfuricurvum sp. IAE1]